MCFLVCLHLNKQSTKCSLWKLFKELYPFLKSVWSRSATLYVYKDCWNYAPSYMFALERKSLNYQAIVRANIIQNDRNEDTVNHLLLGKLFVIVWSQFHSQSLYFLYHTQSTSKNTTLYHFIFNVLNFRYTLSFVNVHKNCTL